MAETERASDQVEGAATQTVEVFAPGKGGYHKSASEEKPESMPEEAPPPVPKSVSPQPQPRPQPQPQPRAKSQAAAPASAPPKPQAQPRPTPKPAPKPKAKAKKIAPADAEGHGKVIAEKVVGGFIGALKGMADRRGGHLLAQDIEALSASFHRQTEKLASSISRTMNMYAESHAQMQWDPERINAFDRILVKQFSHLLGDDAEAVKNPEVISRRALSGVFVAIRMMSGHEKIEQLEQDAYLVMQRVRDDLKDDFEWETVYEDPRTKHMLRDLVVEIAPHFVDLERRLEWMLSVINGHLAPVASGAPGGDWRLSDTGLALLVEALFVEMEKTLEDDMGRMRVTKRYGVESLELILEVVDKIQQHRDALRSGE